MTLVLIAPLRICIKGAENEEAVLCTATETFAIKQVRNNVILEHIHLP